uniref:LAGLIDADG_2 domain-containing protein n=1 Tax=Strongyloides venezuelensis TaxID=75913 RepID=A0A0K0FJD1_STRVS
MLNNRMNLLNKIKSSPKIEKRRIIEQELLIISKYIRKKIKEDKELKEKIIVEEYLAKRKVVTIIILIFVQSSIENRRGSYNQNIAVTGILECDGRPYQNAEIFLFITLNLIRSYKYILNVKRTDAEGWFMIRGRRKSRYSVPFFLQIYHRCKEAVHNMCREIIIRVPRRYAFRNWENLKKYDLRNLELSTLPFKRVSCLRRE